MRVTIYPLKVSCYLEEALFDFIFLYPCESFIHCQESRNKYFPQELEYTFKSPNSGDDSRFRANGC